MLSGLSAGVFTGTATAAVIEAAPEKWRTRAAAVATVANIGGLGIGPLLAGLLVEYAPAPLHLSFIVHIVLALLAGAAVLIVPETSQRTGSIGVQRLSVPAEVRTVFVIASLAAFAGFAVTGLFAAVAPSFLSEVVGIDNHAVAGLIACSIFAASAVAQVAAGKLNPQRAVAIGCAILVVGMVILAVALQFSSLVGIIAAAVVAGIGQGISFSRGLAAVAERTPADRRAEVSSTYFVVAYVAISLPVVGEGLAAQRWGLQTAGETFAVAVAILSAICLVAILVEEARAVPRRARLRQEAADVRREARAQVVFVESEHLARRHDPAEPATLVAGQIIGHRGTCVVGHRLADEAENLFGDTEFVGHEVVEGHVDRSLGCDDVAIADERGEHQFESVDPFGGDLLDRYWRAVHARRVGEHRDHREGYRHRVAMGTHDGHAGEDAFEHRKLLEVLRRLEQPPPAAPQELQRLELEWPGTRRSTSGRAPGSSRSTAARARASP